MKTRSFTLQKESNETRVIKQIRETRQTRLTQQKIQLTPRGVQISSKRQTRPSNVKNEKSDAVTEKENVDNSQTKEHKKKRIKVEEVAVKTEEEVDKSNLLAESVVLPKKNVHRCMFEGCNKQYTTWSNLKNHNEKHHNNNQQEVVRVKMHECSHCGKKYHHLVSLIQHYRVTERKVVKCRVCGDRFQCEGLLRKHDSAEHKKFDRFQCKQCEKSYIGRASLIEHQQHHLSISERKRFYCSSCDQSFVKKNGLIRHMRTHLPTEKKFVHQCHICNRMFQRKDTLKEHILTHQPDEERITYACPYCGKVFKHKSAMNTHKNRHLSDGERRIFDCPKCGKSCPRLSNLKLHMQIHLPLRKRKSYTCSICNSVFVTREGHRLHEEAHLRKKTRYQCPNCPNAYFQKGSLNRHQNTCH